MQDYFAFGSRTSKVDFALDKKFRQNSKPFNATGLSGSWLALQSQTSDDKTAMGLKEKDAMKRRKTWANQQNDTDDHDRSTVDPDEETNAILAKQRRNIVYTLKKGVLPQTKSRKTHYYTARGKGFDMWDEQVEAQHEAKAHIRDTSALLRSTEWEKLVGKGVTTLIIEDDDNVLKVIPPEVASIQTLRSFTLMWSKVKEIPDTILDMSLRELIIQKCSLKSVDGIQQMQELRKLELSNDGLKKIPLEIGEMTSLIDLNLEGNSLKAIPVSIGNLVRLHTLKLCGNSLSALPGSIANLAELTTLDVSHNHIKELPEALGNLSKLVTLRLSHNHLSSFPPSIKDLRRLKHLYVGNNRFTEVPAVLAQLPVLLTLNMVSNHVKMIRSPLQTLTILLLDRNQLSELPITLFSCTSLESLSLQFNQIDKIPAPIMCLTKLRSLYLAGNKLDSLPEELCQLKELRHLVMRETQIQELPNNFDSLRKLSLVDIENTGLSYQFTYALKNNGIEGLLDQVRLSREREQRDSVSDRGSSQFDSEDEAVTDEEHESSRRTIHNPNVPVILRDSTHSTTRKELLTFYPPDIDYGEGEGKEDAASSEKPKEPMPHLSQIWQKENAFYLPSKEPEEDLTIGKAKGTAVAQVKFQMEVDEIPESPKGILKKSHDKVNGSVATKGKDSHTSKHAPSIDRSNSTPGKPGPKVAAKPKSPTTLPAMRMDFNAQNSSNGSASLSTTHPSVLRPKASQHSNEQPEQPQMTHKGSRPLVKKKPVQYQRESLTGQIPETSPPKTQNNSGSPNARSSGVLQLSGNSPNKPIVAPKPSKKPSATTQM